MSDSQPYVPDDRVRAFTGHLVAIRRGKGITSTAVARAMGVSQPAVSKLEHAGQNWRLSTVLKYADAVGMAVLIAEVGHVG